MALTQNDDRTASDTRRTWTIGGTLLLVAVVVNASLQPPALGLAVGAILSSLLFSASLLIFAFGIRGSGSVTARRPLGTTALAVLAIWTLLGPIVSLTSTNDYPSGFMLGLEVVAPYVQLALALIAAVQIARAGVVPRPWNWVPCWALAAVVITGLLAQVIFVIASTNASFMASTLLMLGGLARFGSLLLLGVVAIVLGDRVGRSRVVAAPAPTAPR